MTATDTFTIPQSTPAETLARDTFTSLMWCLSNPGQIFRLPFAADLSSSTLASCELIGTTLLDLETSFFTPDDELKRRLLRSGARFLPVTAAAYHFYPHVAYFQSERLTTTLASIEQANLGTITDPDQSATLVIACELGHGRRLHLSGPGIQHATHLQIDALPTDFWRLRSELNHYPLGIDLFLVASDQVVGVPRTTVIDLNL